VDGEVVVVKRGQNYPDEVSFTNYGWEWQERYFDGNKKYINRQFLSHFSGDCFPFYILKNTTCVDLRLF
jgi:hypothetical protein